MGGVCCLPEGRPDSFRVVWCRRVSRLVVRRDTSRPARRSLVPSGGRRLSASSQGLNDDGSTRNARSFLGNSGRRERWESNLASAEEQDRCRESKLDHRLDCSMWASACGEVLQVFSWGISAGKQPKVNLKAPVSGQRFGSRCPAANECPGSRGARAGSGQHSLRRKGPRARPGESQSQASSEALQRQASARRASSRQQVATAS